MLIKAFDQKIRGHLPFGQCYYYYYYYYELETIICYMYQGGQKKNVTKNTPVLSLKSLGNTAFNNG